jgi:hypothetical protein
MSLKDSELDVDDYFCLEDISAPSRPNEPRLKNQRPTLEEVEAYQADKLETIAFSDLRPSRLVAEEPSIREHFVN